jgi:hypothetical protein
LRIRALENGVPRLKIASEALFFQGPQGAHLCALGGENHPFQNISHGGSRDALVHLLPMKPSAKEFQDSVRGEPPNSVRMDVLVNDIFWEN